MRTGLIAALLFLTAQAAGPVGSLAGSVHDSAGAPLGGLVAVVFPADETAWPDAASSGTARRVPIAAGQFEMASVPAGSYTLVVVDESRLAGWPSPATLRQLVKEHAFPLQLAAGSPMAIDIEVTGSGESTTMGRISIRTTQAVRAGGDPFAPAVRGRPAGPPPSTAPGSISGRVIDRDGQPVAGVEVRSVRRLTINGTSTLANFGASTTTDADGRYRLPNRQAGSDLVVVVVHSSRIPVASPTATLPASNGPRLGSVATFYGDTPDETTATPVMVTTDERSGIDIRLARVPVFSATGSIAREAVSVRPGTPLTLVRIDVFGMPSPLDVQRASLAADGTFRFDDLADGEYELSLGGAEAWGVTRIRVSGREPDPVVITPHAPMTVRGRVEFQGSTPAPAIPGNTPQFGVDLAPAQSRVGGTFVRTPVHADGAFAARGMGPGPFRLRGTVPAPWVQVAGFVGGVDTLDVPVAAGPDVEGALVVFVDRPTAFRATVVDGQGQPVANVGVIVFHEDPRYWTSASRRVRTGTTLASGSCTFTGLPPGRYFAAASPEITPGATVLQALIQKLRPDATPVEISVGQDAALQLSVRR
jgi:Carboxypeptidase regulatory-like domain